MHRIKKFVPPDAWPQAPEGRESAARFAQLGRHRAARVRAEACRLQTLHSYTDHEAWRRALDADLDQQAARRRAGC